MGCCCLGSVLEEGGGAGGIQPGQGLSCVFPGL